jgi:hypothetical protein
LIFNFLKPKTKINMKNLNEYGVSNISHSESIQITGGNEAYDAGYATGRFVGKVIAGVGVLMFFWAL